MLSTKTTLNSDVPTKAPQNAFVFVRIGPFDTSPVACTFELLASRSWQKRVAEIGLQIEERSIEARLASRGSDGLRVKVE